MSTAALQWCAACRAAVTPAKGGCPTCAGPTTETVANRLPHASGRVVVWYETAAARAERYRRLSAARRKITDEIVDLGWALYEDERLSVREAADAIFAAKMTSHSSAELLECSLRREFRKRGYTMRTTAQTLKGRACRATVTCKGTNRHGQPCEGNPVKGSEYCWQHDPSYAANREAIAHMERMRQRRRWNRELVPMQPFVAWLRQRRSELALPPAQRRFADRDEGLTRLSEATGISASTLGKWMQFQSSKNKPKHSITRSKVKQVLEHDATTTFAALYGDDTNKTPGEGGEHCALVA